MLVRQRNQLSADIRNEIGIRRIVAVRRIAKLIRRAFCTRLYHIHRTCFCIRPKPFFYVISRIARSKPRMRCRCIRYLGIATQITRSISLERRAKAIRIRRIRIAVYGMRHRRIDKGKGVVPCAIILFKDLIAHSVKTVRVC